MTSTKPLRGADDRLKAAFTLAEVLITLGIIGVVAALTIPTLLSRTNDKEFETAYQKAKYNIGNGYKQYLASNGIYDVSSLPLMTCKDTACYSDFHKSVFKLMNSSSGSEMSKNLPVEYLKSDKSEISPFGWEKMPYVFSTTDGMTYGVSVDDGASSLSVVVDINSNKKPNNVKKDLYKFRVSGMGRLADVSSELDDGKCRKGEFIEGIGCADLFTKCVHGTSYFGDDYFPANNPDYIKKCTDNGGTASSGQDWGDSDLIKVAANKCGFENEPADSMCQGICPCNILVCAYED